MSHLRMQMSEFCEKEAFWWDFSCVNVIGLMISMSFQDFHEFSIFHDDTRDATGLDALKISGNAK